MERVVIRFKQTAVRTIILHREWPPTLLEIYTCSPYSGKCSFVCYNSLSVKALIRAARRDLLARSLRNHGISADSRRFRRARDQLSFLRAGRLSGRAIYAGKWLQSALDPTREILLSFSSLRPSSSFALVLHPLVRLTGLCLVSGSLACRKVQNTRRKRAIRDRTPLTFHFSWS